MSEEDDPAEIGRKEKVQTLSGAWTVHGNMGKKKEFNVDLELKRLEEINQKLAGKDISLEDSLELYKEGTVLAAKCKEHLEGVRKELKIINENS